MAEEGGSEGGAPEWMVSYADMITIMMAFFVVLYASTSASGDKDKGGKSGEEAQGGKEPVQRVSAEGVPGVEGKPGGGNTNDDRMQKVFESLYHRFGPEWTMTNCWSGGPPALHNRGKPGGQGFGGGEGERPSNKSHGHTRDAYSVMVAPKTNDNIVAGGRLYFQEGSAKLNEEQVKLLRSVANDLAGKMQKIEIRGHSSRRPLAAGARFADHWDLAYARCRVVEKCLASQEIDVRRIRLSVAGPNEPMAQDADSPTLAQDARVEIRLLNEWIKEPTMSGPPGNKPLAAMPVNGGR